MNKEFIIAIEQTKSWLEQIIIGLNFCPFAKKEFVNQTIDYYCSEGTQIKGLVKEIVARCEHLEKHDEIETSLVVLTDGFRSFDRYLDLIEQAEDALIEHGFEGVFQLATMHPEYCFADDDYDDAANFTNRSPYPMVHIIREASLARVLSVYKNPEQIPEDNIELARAKGSQYFQQILKGISATHH